MFESQILGPSVEELNDPSSTQYAPHVSRRDLIKGAAIVGGVTLIGGGTLSQVACSGPKLSTWVQTIIGALEELKPLLPAQTSAITKIIKVATDFNAAYQSGKFKDAITIFENLSTLVDQLISDLGTPSQQVKVIVAVVGIALRTIAVLLRNQASQPEVAATVAAAGESSAVNVVKRLSEPSAIDALFRTVKP
jgi:hypothetical protein